MTKTLTLLTTGALLLPLTAAGAIDSPSPRGAIALHYERARLSAEISEAPLAEVLAALRRLPGIRLRTMGDASADRPVSVTVHAVPLAEGIGKILRDTSYVLQMHGEELTVFVLLEPGPRATTSPRPPSAEGDRDGGPHTSASSPGASSSLASRERSDLAEEPDEPTQEGSSMETGEARAEARLRHALAAMQSSQRDVQAEALDELAYSSDPRAIDALTQMATGTLTATPATRVHAVVALARHALQRTSGDPSLVPVLKQLADHWDDSVRAVARQTLEDLQEERE